jgi:hypothetical protein
VNKRHFIHVGYGKAGSSALQCNFFPNCKEIYFYGITWDTSQNGEVSNGRYLSDSGRRIVQQIVYPEFFDKFLENDIRDLEYHKKISDDENKAFVLSNDHLSLLVAPEWSIQKLKDLFPDGKIIITLRRQQDIIKSLYKYKGCLLRYVPRKYQNSYVSFNEWFDYAYFNYNNRGGHKARDWVADYLRIIDFKRMLNFYGNIFGFNNIHVLLYEELRNNPELFYRKLLNILGVEGGTDCISSFQNKIINKSQSTARLQYISLKSKLFGNYLFSEHIPGARYISKLIHNVLDKYNSTSIDINDEQRKILVDIYGKGNKEISNKFGLHLEDYGYYVT